MVNPVVSTSCVARCWRVVPLALGLVAALAAPAAGHEKGVLRVAQRRAAAGDTVTVSGEKLPRGVLGSVRLVGTRGAFELARVRFDPGGRFEASLVIPDSAVPGPYRLVAVTSDGDEVGSVSLLLVAAEAPLRARPGAGPMLHGADGSAATAMPNGGPMPLERRRPTGELIVVALLVALFAGAGWILLRPRIPQ